MKARRQVWTIVTGVIVAFGGSAIRAAEAPASEPSAPARSAKISDDAKQLISQATDAYGKLKSLELAGSISTEAQVGGAGAEKHSTTFSSSFVPPNRFRHDVKDDILIGSTGQKLYMFKADENAYTIADAPKDKVASKDLPGPMARLLQLQDPSLLLAMSKNPGEEVMAGVSEAATIEQTKVGDVTCPTLKLVQDDKSVVTLAIDPQSHLIRQAKFDLTGSLKQRRPDLTSAVVTVEYTTSNPDGQLKDEFAWSAPAGAVDADAMAAAHTLETATASSLDGKEAPKFKLDSIDGGPVSLADLKDHVVVLDFWATWCGPCRASLPHLDKLYQAMKDKGLKVYAVDQREEKGDVADFIKETKLGVPVLLDTDGSIGAKYGVEGIPQTVVIGKDGKVRKVFVGFSPDGTPEQLKEAVDAAMK